MAALVRSGCSSGSTRRSPWPPWRRRWDPGHPPLGGAPDRGPGPRRPRRADAVTGFGEVCQRPGPRAPRAGGRRGAPRELGAPAAGRWCARPPGGGPRAARVSVILATGVCCSCCRDLPAGGLTVGSWPCSSPTSARGYPRLASSLGTLWPRSARVRPLAPLRTHPGPGSGLTAHALHLQRSPGPPRRLAARRPAREPRGAGLTARHAASGRGIEGRPAAGAGQPDGGHRAARRGQDDPLAALLGLAPREAGGALERVRRDPRRSRPARAAHVPQAPVLFSETLRENILLGTPADGVALACRLGAVLEEDVAGFRGLDTVVGPRGVRLGRAGPAGRRGPRLVRDRSSSWWTTSGAWTPTPRPPFSRASGHAASRAWRPPTGGRCSAAPTASWCSPRRVAAEGTPAELLATCAEFAPSGRGRRYP